jgi:ribonuclease BN (tRNA processing enzyme)
VAPPGAGVGSTKTEQESDSDMASMIQELELTVLGCGDAFNSGARMHSCFHLKTPDKTLLIDCGATALLGLKQQQLPSDEIDMLLVSHFHGDHIAGVPFLLLDMARQLRRKSLHIICPEGGEERIVNAVRLFYPGSGDLFQKFPIIYHEFAGQQVLEIEGVKMLSFPVVHKAESKPHGFRIETAGKTIAYSGDTEWTDTLISIAKNADLFLCECTFYDQQVPMHLSYQLLEQHLDKLECRRIILTHLDEEMLRQQHNIKLQCAYDGMKLFV